MSQYQKRFVFLAFLTLAMVSVTVVVVQLQFIRSYKVQVPPSATTIPSRSSQSGRWLLIEDPCPRLGLEENPRAVKTWPSAIKCRPHRSHKAACMEANSYHGLRRPGHVEDRKCDEAHYPDICSFQETRPGHHKLFCNAEVCGGLDAKIGSTDPERGVITKWRPSSLKTLTKNVGKAVETNRQNGFGYLFIRCGNILQSLIFPPILQKDNEDSRKSKINVNVIVLDSIARTHFYRILPKSVAALREIAQDPKLKTTALDFELFQSVGQATFDNMRPFFSGIIRDDNKISETVKSAKAPLGVEVLYETFKRWGYQTLYQEDLCWYDTWGIGLTNLDVRSKPSTDSEFKERWSEFQADMSTKYIDDFGLLHFSCPVLKKYNLTSHYEDPPMVCLNGQFFNQYFLDYISKVYTELRNDKNAKSILSFMHFNTGHEYTGVRMINMDANLAKFVHQMAKSPDTLTVIFSDHGNKNTEYSFTEEGRREAFDPVMFMLIPDGVAKKLGQQRMMALVENQKRLFTLFDLHRALVSLNDPKKIISRKSSEVGIFAVLPANRTCADLTLMPLTRCKCEGFDDNNHAEDNSEKHKWLAEYALGTLNDAIQTQHMGGNNSKPLSSTQKYGFGNCQRLVGKSFKKIFQHFHGDYVITTMDIHVVPPKGYNEDEVFSVALKHYARPEDNVWLTGFTRQTKYSKFKSCTDKSVDVKLCACAKKQGTGEDTIQVPREMFGSRTIVKDLDLGCLLFLRRDYGSIALALEVTNICADRTYKFEMSGWAGEKVFSKELPINLELSPKTFYFLTSVNKLVSKDTFPLTLEATIHLKKRESKKFEKLRKVPIT